MWNIRHSGESTASLSSLGGGSMALRSAAGCQEPRTQTGGSGKRAGRRGPPKGRRLAGAVCDAQGECSVLGRSTKSQKARERPPATHIHRRVILHCWGWPRSRPLISPHLASTCLWAARGLRRGRRRGGRLQLQAGRRDGRSLCLGGAVRLALAVSQIPSSLVAPLAVMADRGGLLAAPRQYRSTARLAQGRRRSPAARRPLEMHLCAASPVLTHGRSAAWNLITSTDLIKDAQPTGVSCNVLHASAATSTSRSVGGVRTRRAAACRAAAPPPARATAAQARAQSPPPRAGTWPAPAAARGPPGGSPAGCAPTPGGGHT